MHRLSHSMENYPAPNINNAEVEKPSPRPVVLRISRTDGLLKQRLLAPTPRGVTRWWWWCCGSRDDGVWSPPQVTLTTVLRHQNCSTHLTDARPKALKGDKHCPKLFKLLSDRRVSESMSIQAPASIGAHRLWCSAKGPRTPGWYLWSAFFPTRIILYQRSL